MDKIKCYIILPQPMLFSDGDFCIYLYIKYVVVAANTHGMCTIYYNIYLHRTSFLQRSKHNKCVSGRRDARIPNHASVVENT